MANVAHVKGMLPPSESKDSSRSPTLSPSKPTHVTQFVINTVEKRSVLKLLNKDNSLVSPADRTAGVNYNIDTNELEELTAPDN